MLKKLDLYARIYGNILIFIYFQDVISGSSIVSSTCCQQKQSMELLIIYSTQTERKQLSELLVKIMIWTLNCILILLRTNHFAKTFSLSITSSKYYAAGFNQLVRSTAHVYVVYSSSFRLLIKILIHISPFCKVILVFSLSGSTLKYVRRYYIRVLFGVTNNVKYPCGDDGIQNIHCP